ncbi:MAG: hypothetical protein ACLP50_24895 [Solirubrobacteraceae bacterium]
MRTRFSVLAVILCGLAMFAVPAAASAAPHHNKGLTINATPNPIIAGDGVLVYGQLNGADNANQTITLYHRIVPAAGFTVISITKTNALGFYEFTRADGIVMSNRNWFVRGPDATHSRTLHERVASLVTLSSPTTSATTDETVDFTGSVSPDHVGQRVLLQEQNSSTGTRWVTIMHTFTTSGSTFTFAKRFRVPGDYTLRAFFPTDPRNIAGESDSLTLQVQQKQLADFTIASSEPIAPEGTAVTISGVLDAAGTTTPKPTTQVTLYGKQNGGTFEALATTVTGTDGSYSFAETPVHNTVYYVGETLTPAHHSAVLFQGVQDILTVGASSPTGTVGGNVTVSGTVSPDKTGHAIYLQVLGADGAWHDVAAGTVTTGSVYSFTYTFGKAGSVELRARIYGGPENVGAASTPVTVAVSGVAPASSLPPASGTTPAS